jgi:Family of unknown function (DUF5947)
VTVSEGHRHAVDTERHEVLCVCYACSVAFNREEASEGHYRLVPQRRTRVPELSPASLGVPVGLAFFVVQRDGSVLAHYPSPAGATRWEADPQAWRVATGACGAVGDLAPEVEALLVTTARGRSEAWLAGAITRRRGATTRTAPRMPGARPGSTRGSTPPS